MLILVGRLTILNRFDSIFALETSESRFDSPQSLIFTPLGREPQAQAQAGRASLVQSRLQTQTVRVQSSSSPVDPVQSSPVQLQDRLEWWVSMTVLTTWEDFERAAERLYLQDPMRVSKQKMFWRSINRVIRV